MVVDLYFSCLNIHNTLVKLSPGKGIHYVWTLTSHFSVRPTVGRLCVVVWSDPDMVRSRGLKLKVGLSEGPWKSFYKSSVGHKRRMRYGPGVQCLSGLIYPRTSNQL